uniref:Uncharacterized protein n=1 Tax=Anguilla anguilla TaxID=7936 RepID=A0A0E9V4L9_ANGAN
MSEDGQGFCCPACIGNLTAPLGGSDRWEM